MRKTLSLSAMLLLLASPLALADESAGGEAKRIVQSLGEQTVAAAKIEDKEARRRLLVEAAAPAVDFKTIGEGVLSYAGVSVPAGRRAEVMDGVIAFVSRSILDEIERIRPESAKLGDATVTNASEVRVGMQLTGIKDQIDADWVVKKQDAGWRVTDVMVAGNSLTAHFGGQLARRARGEVEPLVEFLRTEQKRDRVAALAQ